jgi:hypothetical protein
MRACAERDDSPLAADVVGMSENAIDAHALDAFRLAESEAGA